MQRNCYDILGVDCKASTEEIKIAFRQLAKQWHPDLNPQLSRRGEQFTHIHQAYRILCNPKERARHDAELKTKPHPQKPEASPSRPKPSANAQKKATPKNTAKPRPHATPSEQDLVAKKIALFLNTLKELFQFSKTDRSAYRGSPSRPGSSSSASGRKSQVTSFDRVFQSVKNQEADDFVVCTDGIIRRRKKTATQGKETPRSKPGTAPRHAWRAGLGILALLLIKCWQQLFR